MADGDAWTVADPTLCPICHREACEDHLPPDEDVPPPVDDPSPVLESYADRLARVVETERLRREARRILDAEERPPVAVPTGRPLRDRLARPVPAQTWRIAGWQAQQTRVMLTAQAKCGKTILRDNYIRSLVDGDPFLGVADVTPITGALVLLDFEMPEYKTDAWLRSQCIRDDDRVVVYNLRQAAAGFNLLDERIRLDWAARLRADGAEALVLDCVRPVLDAVGLDEQHDAGRFLVAFDRLLEEAAIPDCLTVHHMGHTNDRARGDSRLRDWPDAEWRMVRKDDSPSSTRFISAYGRDVDVAETCLSYDSLSRHLTIGDGGSRKAVKRREALAAIVAWLKAEGKPTTGRGIKAGLAGAVPRDDVESGLALGVQTQTLTVELGARQAQLYRVVGP